MKVEIPEELIREAIEESAQEEPEEAVAAHVINRIAGLRGRRRSEEKGEPHVSHRYVAEEKSRLDRKTGLYLWQRNVDVEELKNHPGGE